MKECHVWYTNRDTLFLNNYLFYRIKFVKYITY